jgi:hypothetical protein
VERHGVERIHGQVAEHDRRNRGEGVARGTQTPQRLQSARPSVSLPRNAPITTANERPRANAGTSAIGGKCISDAQDMSSSGSVGSSALQVCSTSDARSKGKNIAPA